MGLFIVRCERGLVIVARRYEVKNILCVRCQKLNKFAVKATNSPRCQYSFLSLLKRIFFLAVKKKNLLAVKTDSLAVKIFLLSKKFSTMSKKKIASLSQNVPSLSKQITSRLQHFFCRCKN